MKKWSSSLLICMLLIGGLPVTTQAANGYNTYPGNHKLKGGVGNYGKNRCYFWIHPDAKSEAAIIRSAMSNWVNTSIRTPISFRETGKKTAGTIEVDKGNKYIKNIAAETYYRIGTKGVDVTKKNWNWAYIVTRKDYKSLPKNMKKAVLGHEIGHAFGLEHYDKEKNSIMHPVVKNSTRTYPAAGELRGINYLY